MEGLEQQRGEEIEDDVTAREKAMGMMLEGMNVEVRREMDGDEMMR